DAVIMIQYALQIRFMDGRLFPLAFLLAVSVYAFGMLVIIEPRRIFHIHGQLFSILIAVSGVLGLLSLLLAWIRTRNLTKEERRDRQRILEEDPTDWSPIPGIEEKQPLEEGTNEARAVNFEGETQEGASMMAGNEGVEDAESPLVMPEPAFSEENEETA
ncbi:MAG: hypothetical protein IJ679_00280, partial [Lachnospiraceae bacterium]|nr:hypothetical protein [Lachnospiraceae bacterium]